ncbi:MAG: anti-sigma factor antagonist [Candidatus Omnitrophota bacterium]
MDIKIRHLKDIAVLDINGAIDINASSLIESVGSLLKQGASKIIINLDDVDFIDYNGLSVLAIAYKSALNSKGTIKLSNVPAHVMELLCIVKLDSVFSIYENVDKAVESFNLKKPLSSTEPSLKSPLRRRFKRLGIDINIYYKKATSSHQGNNPLYSGLAGNISGAGLFLRTINVFPAGTKVELDIVLPKIEKSVSFKGLVVWVGDKQLQPDLYPGMGVQFVDINQKTQEELISFIEENIAK